MADISSLYSSSRTVYRKTGKQSSKNLHGDVKHIIYKEGRPVVTEIIRVKKDPDQTPHRNPEMGLKPKRIRAATRERRSSDEVLRSKKDKLSDRLKKAIQLSQTLWSEKEGIYISYQGSHGFLVKLYNENQQEIRNEIMSQAQILESAIPGLLDTGWEVV